MSGVSKPYSELYSPVRNDAAKFHLRLRFALKICALGARTSEKKKGKIFKIGRGQDLDRDVGANDDISS
jgi:hypothetical protein